MCTALMTDSGFRDYPSVPDYRGRPVTPPLSSRYSDTARSGPIDGPGGARYR